MSARVPAGVRAGGQFAASPRHETGVRLSRRRAIDDYFDGGVREYVEAPWVQARVHVTLVPQEWRELPVRAFPLAGLKRTQARVLAKHVDRHLAGGTPQGDDLPWVVVYGGEHWVLDGHHRVVAGIERGDTDIEAHYIDLDATRDEPPTGRTSIWA